MLEVNIFLYTQLALNCCSRPRACKPSSGSAAAVERQGSVLASCSAGLDSALKSSLWSAAVTEGSEPSYEVFLYGGCNT